MTYTVVEIHPDNEMQAEQWIRHTIGYENEINHTWHMEKHIYCFFYFEDPEDALAVKLRWGGE